MAVKLAPAAEPGIDIDTNIAGKSDVLARILDESDLTDAHRRQIRHLNDPYG